MRSAARHDRVRQVRRLVRLARINPPKDQTNFEGLGFGTIRQEAIFDLLQDVHRKRSGAFPATSIQADWPRSE